MNEKNPLNHNIIDEKLSFNFGSSLHNYKRNVILPTITLEGKPYDYNKNEGILIKQNTDSFNEAFNVVFNNNNMNLLEDEEIKIDVFNYMVFKEKQKKDKNENGINIKGNIPAFISIKEILDKHRSQLSVLWDNSNEKYAHIFDNELDLLEVENNGEIFINTIIYLDKSYLKGTQKHKRLKPSKMSEAEMIIKIKNHLFESFFKATNTFKPFNFCAISKIKGKTINKDLVPDFYLEYLDQKLYNILSNNSSETNGKTNYENIKEVIDEFNKDNNQTFLIDHLFLTVHDCLNIFRYEKTNQNSKFKYKLVDFLSEEFTKQIKKNNDFSLKDYIASLILLTYNFELFFHRRKKNKKKKNNSIKDKNKTQGNCFDEI